MGLRHRDRWLTDWIAASHAGANAEADGHLAAAAAAGAAGAAERALSEAKAAAGLYREVRNRPGMVRAELAETYALQRLGRAEECLESAAAVAREPLTKDYAWVAGQLLIEQSDCRLLEHRFAEAREDVERSLELTAAAGLPDLHLRALGTQAAVLNLSGRTAAAWQADATGLGLCQQAECSAIRKYQFLYDMVAEAQTLGLPNVASDLMRTTAGVAGRTGDATIHAYALEGLGTLAGRVGDYATSTRAFDEAAAKAEQLGPAARLYRADWQTDRAEILSRRGENAQALGVLQESSGVILASDYEVGRLHYLRAMAAVERAEGRTDEALASIQTAVREVDRSRELLHTTAERTQWSNASAPVYAELVKVYLARRQEDDALRAWERFRGAAYAPPAATPAKAAADARVLVLARVDDGYVGWLATVDPLHVLRTVRIGEGASLRRSAAAFYRLCADRGSAVADVKAVGGRLYGALIGPFERDLGGSRRIWIDADPSLAMLPFAALTTAKGEWLSDAMEIAVLPAWWSLDAGAATADAPVGAANSAVVVSAGTSYSEAAAIAKVFPHARVIDGAEATTGHVLEGLGGAEVFHFSGHATAARLMLVSGENAEPVLTAEALGSMHLRGCRIAVLAACNTTATDPDQIEELTDLRNAMLLAGAHTVVASSWDVDDRSTQALMVAFYKLLVAGRTPAQALGFAQQAVRSDDAWRHPYYWASFETFAN
jgi:tetratricopeptide (TPR) repeat protein